MLLAGIINELETAEPEDLLAYIILFPIDAADCVLIEFPTGMINGHTIGYKFQNTEQQENNIK